MHDMQHYHHHHQRWQWQPTPRLEQPMAHHHGALCSSPTEGRFGALTEWQREKGYWTYMNYTTIGLDYMPHWQQRAIVALPSSWAVHFSFSSSFFLEYNFHFCFFLSFLLVFRRRHRVVEKWLANEFFLLIWKRRTEIKHEVPTNLK